MISARGRYSMKAASLLLFLLVRATAHSQTLTTLYSFTGGSDGASPYGGLIQASDGNLYGTASDFDRLYLYGTIFRITPSGTFTVLHTFEYLDGANPQASLIQASDGNLYGTNVQGGAYGYGTIYRIPLPMSWVYANQAQVGSTGSGNGQFEGPTDVAVDGSGDLFVVDETNVRVQKFDHNGNYLTQFGSYGTGNGQFNQPYGIAVDGSGNVFVADSGYSRIEKFDNNGNYLAQFGTSGSGPGQFANPFGVAVDGGGNVFVADTGNARIEKLDNNGNFLAQFGGNGQVSQPYGVAVDGGGNVFVADSGNNRIEKFDNNVSYLGQFGTAGNAAGQLEQPSGVAVDGSGNVFVADYGNHRVDKFAQAPTTTPTFGPNTNHTSGLFSLAVADPFASIDSTTFSLDGGAFGFYSDPISINDGRLHIILAQSTDSAGNEEDLQAFYFAAAPVALSLSPDHVPTGNGPTPLTLGGAGFDANCVLCLDGHALATTYVDVNNLQATLPNFTTTQAHTLTVKDKSVTPHLVSNTLVLRVGKARLAASAVLSRDGNNNVVATLTLKNTGPIGSDATGVTLNTATLTNLTVLDGAISPTSPTLPYGVSTVTAGSSQTVTLTFPASVGTSGQTVRLALTGVFTGGTFSVSGQKKLP